MTDFQKSQLERAINQLEVRIDSYNRLKEQKRKQAIYEGECGYRETAQFNKGQEFALGYVADDLQIILETLKLMGRD